MNQTLNKTMKAVAIDRFGGIETLQTRQLPIPDVGTNEVLVRVEAAGVGVWDPFEREGGFAKEYNVQPTFPLCSVPTEPEPWRRSVTASKV